MTVNARLDALGRRIPERIAVILPDLESMSEEPMSRQEYKEALHECRLKRERARAAGDKLYMPTPKPYSNWENDDDQK